MSSFSSYGLAPGVILAAILLAGTNARADPPQLTLQPTTALLTTGAARDEPPDRPTVGDYAGFFALNMIEFAPLLSAGAFLVLNPDPPAAVMLAGGISGFVFTASFMAVRLVAPTRTEILLATFMPLSLQVAGVGIPLLFRGQGPGASSIVGAAIGYLGALGATIPLARRLHLELRDGDATLIGLTLAFGIVQTVGWGNFDNNTVAGQSHIHLAAALTGTGLAGVGAVALAQVTHWSRLRVWATFAGALWGGIIGVWATDLAQVPERHGAPPIMLASLAGLATTALLAAPPIGFSTWRLVWMSAGAAIGVALAAWTEVALSNAHVNSPGLPVFGITGTLLGLTVGAALAPRWSE